MNDRQQAVAICPQESQRCDQFRGFHIELRRTGEPVGDGNELTRQRSAPRKKPAALLWQVGSRIGHDPVQQTGSKVQVQGKIFPGFRIFLGSSAALMRFIEAIASA